ncbi:cupin domain-containing protein [Maribellus maritimus]|uniref:cupin domain-containing protein n=1 Tax=Maribellus maritimus TaxID=2870838 RepID=UPI001EEB8B5B|nr:cupin domain-containing protein [Maribellus maritimus]MCG6189558.1 cupin domain-containing protein [Maribellus maritimus]
MKYTAHYFINKLQLQKHPEGGWFREIYRSEEVAEKVSLPDSFSGERNFSTSIYYLLEGNDFSAFHRIKSDEIWHFYAGTSAVEIWMLINGELVKQRVGNQLEAGDVFQFVVPKNTWFAARLLNAEGFALVGCTVSPGFYFGDFELADKKLVTEFSDLAEEIRFLIKQ